MSYNNWTSFSHVGIDWKSEIASQLFDRLWMDVFVKVFIVNAVFKVIGLACNVLSFIIFYRSNFKSPSSVLILLLTVGETMYTLRESDMITIRMLYNRNILDKVGFGFQVASIVVQAVEHIGTYASSTIIVLITIDRCIAVIFPLRYSSFVTVRRTWALSILTYILWTLWCSVVHLLYFICEGRDEDPLDICSSTILIDIKTDAAMVVETTMSIGPVVIVIIGCVVIGFKIKLSQKMRNKLVVNRVERRPSLRTTKMLLAISIAFAVVNGYSFLVTLLGNKAQYLYNIIIDIALMASRYIFVDINSTYNFVIYVLSNAKFRQIFLNILSPKCWAKKNTPAT